MMQALSATGVETYIELILINPAGGGPTSHLPPGEGGHKVAPLLSQLLHDLETPNLAGG